jgi:hexosaminidase
MSAGNQELWPAPIIRHSPGGELRLTGPVHLDAGVGAAGWTDTLLERLAWLRVRPGRAAPGAVGLRVDHDPALGEEEFILRTDPAAGISIVAGSLLGAGHATVTLRQLLPADAHRSTPIRRDSWIIPAAHIQDRPALAWRGFMLDVARHFTPKDELLTIIDRMALHRLNRLHLHLTDDHGWRFESRAYPALAEVASWRAETGIGMFPFDGSPQDGDGTPHGGYYTHDDLREITAHARTRGIVVVPEVDLPAHASALLAAVPQLRVPGLPIPEVATRFGLGGRVVSPLPEGREALATILAELADAVDSPFLHLGGDEASLADWDASPAVRAYMTGRGIGSAAGLRADLTRFLAEQAAALGRRPIFWEEAYLAGGIPADAIVMAWRAENLGLDAMAAGHDVVMTPIDGNYLDYADSSDDGLAIGTGQTMQRVADYSPSRGDGPGNLLGVQAALWTELVPDARTRTARMFPRLAMHAANAWTGRPTPWPATRPALETHLHRLAAAGVEFRPLDAPQPWQRGGHGHRAATSPVTLDMVTAMTQMMLASPEPPTAEDIAALLGAGGHQPA